MSFTTIYNPGQANGSGATDALYRTRYTTEVMQAFEVNFEFTPLFTPTQLMNEIGTEFWSTGIAVARGRNSSSDRLDMLKGQNFSQNKKVITVDPLIYVAHYIDRYDEKKSPIAAQQISAMATAQGQAIAKNLNAKCVSTLIQAAKSSTPNVVGQAGGIVVEVPANTFDDGKKLLPAVEQMATSFKVLHKINPALHNMYLALPPGIISQAKLDDVRLNNKEFSYKLDATEPNKDAMLGGFQVFESYTLLNTNLTTDAQVVAAGLCLEEAEAADAFPSKYRGNFSNVVGIAFNKEAIAAVVLSPLDAFVEDYNDRQGKLIASTVGMGFGIKDQRFAILLAYED